ncbi:MAG: TonB-dependent receptor plug domain-containing protein [Desulfobacterales bacterium]|nr:TonB-dependent receptor plug domain-containing protein [Desulfobacterales bacterium]
MNTFIYQIVMFLVSISLLSTANAQDQYESIDKETMEAIDQEVRYQQEEKIDYITIASRLKQTTGEAPSVVSVITANEIKRMGAKNLEEVLRQVAGFDVYPNSNEPNPQIGIRGFSNSRNGNRSCQYWNAKVNGYGSRTKTYIR